MKRYTAKEIEQIMLLSQGVVSLNDPIIVNDEVTDEMINSIVDDSPSPEDELLEKNKAKIINEFITQCLNPKEQKIVRLRYGLDDGRARTLEEIGQEIGITRERVRQIEAKAIRKLRWKFSHHKIRRENI